MIPRHALLLALLLAGCVNVSKQALVGTSMQSIHYPRRAMYAKVVGSGAPFIRKGLLDEAVCDTAARFDVLVLDAPPILARPDIVEAIRKRNPSITLLAFLAVHSLWENPHPGLGDTLTDHAWLRWALARRMDGFLWNTRGRLFNVNLDLSDHRVALAMAELDAKAASPANGLFLDTFCTGILWAQSPGDSIDLRRAGWDTAKDFDRAWREGHRIYLERLRQLVGDKLLVCNCGPSGERDVANGWMRENFPLQNGGDWSANMVRTPWGDPGYLADDTLYQAPTLNFLSTIESPDSVTNHRRLVFGLASATLAGGVHVLVPPKTLRAWNPRWFSEYDIDLGNPLGPARQEWATWVRYFEHGAVVVDPARGEGRFITHIGGNP